MDQKMKMEFILDTPEESTEKRKPYEKKTPDTEMMLLKFEGSPSEVPIDIVQKVCIGEIPIIETDEGQLLECEMDDYIERMRALVDMAQNEELVNRFKNVNWKRLGQIDLEQHYKTALSLNEKAAAGEDVIVDENFLREAFVVAQVEFQVYFEEALREMPDNIESGIRTVMYRYDGAEKYAPKLNELAEKDPLLFLSPARLYPHTYRTAFERLALRQILTKQDIPEEYHSFFEPNNDSPLEPEAEGLLNFFMDSYPPAKYPKQNIREVPESYKVTDAIFNLAMGDDHVYEAIKWLKDDEGYVFTEYGEPTPIRGMKVHVTFDSGSADALHVLETVSEVAKKAGAGMKCQDVASYGTIFNPKGITIYPPFDEGKGSKTGPEENFETAAQLAKQIDEALMSKKVREPKIYETDALCGESNLVSVRYGSISSKADKITFLDDWEDSRARGYKDNFPSEEVRLHFKAVAEKTGLEVQEDIKFITDEAVDGMTTIEELEDFLKASVGIDRGETFYTGVELAELVEEARIDRSRLNYVTSAHHLRQKVKELLN